MRKAFMNRSLQQRHVSLYRWCVIALPLTTPAILQAQQVAAACHATATSMMPSGWRAPSRPSQSAPTPGLKLVAEIPLPGPANRFDYQSFDPALGRLYINHMNAGRLVVFNADSGKMTAEVSGL